MGERVERLNRRGYYLIVVFDGIVMLIGKDLAESRAGWWMKI
jgi:hypothetical protein